MLTAALAALGSRAPAHAAGVGSAHSGTDQAGGRQHRAFARRIAQAAQTRRPGQTRPVVRLTLEEAVKFALERNLDIAVQRLNPEINDIAYRQHQVGLSPGADVAPSAARRTTTPMPGQPISGAQRRRPIVTGDSHTVNGGIAQSVPWGGGAFTVALNNNRQTRRPA